MNGFVKNTQNKMNKHKPLSEYKHLFKYLHWSMSHTYGAAGMASGAMFSCLVLFSSSRLGDKF